MYAPLALTAPVFQIIVNATTSSKATSHTGAIAGGVTGGVVALILVVGAIAFVRRQLRQDNFRKSAGTSFSGTAMLAGSPMTVTPFDPALAGTALLEAGSQSGTTRDGPSSLLPPSQSAASVPVGLTSKELAQLRSATTRSPLTTHWHARTSSNGSQPTLVVGTSEGRTSTPTPETWRLQSEVESLRREMQELRAERFEAPPSYGIGEGA
ncbi:hypothetical protein EDB87DRAFT_1604477 [Lactarius vividus]|nr:hypothetical protein EDB87DRAFT_1604477 [Lactarius vividus]